MEDLYMELFNSMNQFRRLHMSDLMPGKLNQADFFTLNCILDAEDGRITISKLASKSRVLPSAISRTLKGLEEQHYVERNVDKGDRRNTYVTLTEAGRAVTVQSRQIMYDFGRAVTNRLNEKDVKQLIHFLDEIYQISKTEIEARKQRDRKGTGNEQNI